MNESDWVIMLLCEMLAMADDIDPMMWMPKPPVGMWVVEQTHVLRGGDVCAVGKVKGYAHDGGVILESLDGSEQTWRNAAFRKVHGPVERHLSAYRNMLKTKGKT